MTAVPPSEPAGIAASHALVERAAAALVSAIMTGGRSEGLIDRARALQAARSELRRAAQDGRDGQGAEGLPALREDLRDGVRRYAIALRAAGTPPERMLRLVKEAVAPALRTGHRDERIGRISDDVVRWSLDAYYAA